MRAIEEVGLKKTFRFLFYCFIQVIYHDLIDHLFYFSHARKMVLISLGASIGKDTILMDANFFNWHHKGPGGLKIGKECFIADGCLIDLYDSVTFEDQVTLAPRVIVLTHTNVGYKNHPLQRYYPKISSPVVLKKGCVIGTGSIIMPGVTVGKEALVGAGSIVTKNVMTRTVVAGNPAKKIKKIMK